MDEQSISIGGNIVVTVVKVTGRQVRLGAPAPDSDQRRNPNDEDSEQEDRDEEEQRAGE